MHASQRRAMSLMPRRLRTIMIVNVVVAVFMVILTWLNAGVGGRGNLIASTILLLLALSAIGAIITVPMVLVQIYLYPKNHGLWYAWENRSERGLYASTQVPRLTSSSPLGCGRGATFPVGAAPVGEEGSHSPVRRCPADRLGLKGRASC